MRIELTTAQKGVQQMTRWFAENVIRPASLEADRTHDFPDDVLRQIDQISGGGMAAAMAKSPSKDSKKEEKESFVQRTLLVATEEMAWGDVSAILSMPGPGLGGPPVKIVGTPEQQERFLGIFKDKSVLRWGAYALTEPAAGSDVAGIRARCRKEGDEWVISGTKCFITNGAKAAWNVVFATVDPELGRAGHRIFVVERDRPGFSVGRLEEKMGLRASETAELHFEECRVPVENLLGGEERYGGSTAGFMGAMKTFDSTRPLVAIMGVGIARAAAERAREIFEANAMADRPVAAYRRARSILNAMDRDVAAARLMCWHAAQMADQGKPNAKEASMSKAYAGQRSVDVCWQALRVAGAVGVHDDPWLDKWFRDIKVHDIYEGTGEIQRIVISKRLIPGLRSF